MLKKGSTVLSIWCGINFILAFIILSYVIVLKQNSPILQVASFSEAEIAGLERQDHCCAQLFHDPVQLLLADGLGVDVAAYPQKSGRWRKIGFLDAGFRDRLYRSDGIYRFFLHWTRTLASECSSERFISGGHWHVGLLPISE